MTDEDFVTLLAAAAAAIDARKEALSPRHHVLDDPPVSSGTINVHVHEVGQRYAHLEMAERTIFEVLNHEGHTGDCDEALSAVQAWPDAKANRYGDVAEALGFHAHEQGAA